MHNFDPAQLRSAQPLSQFVSISLRSNRHDLGPPPLALLKRQINVAARRHCDNRKAVRIALANTERGLPDRAGGTEDGESFHLVNTYKLKHDCVDRNYGRCKQQRVDSIE